LPHVLLRLVGKDFALASTHVLQIARPEQLQVPPDRPVWLSGYLRKGPAEIPVLDLCHLLQMKGGQQDAVAQHVLLVEDPDTCQVWGLQVQRVLRVAVLPLAQLVLPPALRQVWAGQFLRGVLEHEGRSLYVLALALLLRAPTRMLHRPRLASLASAAAVGSAQGS